MVLYTPSSVFPRCSRFAFFVHGATKFRRSSSSSLVTPVTYRDIVAAPPTTVPAAIMPAIRCAPIPRSAGSAISLAPDSRDLKKDIVRPVHVPGQLSAFPQEPGRWIGNRILDPAFAHPRVPEQVAQLARVRTLVHHAEPLYVGIYS